LGAIGDSEKTQDRQTESGVRCVGYSGGDAQPSLLLFFDSLRPYSLQFSKTLLLKSSLKPCLKPFS
jgi:hypothetical protein